MAGGAKGSSGQQRAAEGSSGEQRGLAVEPGEDGCGRYKEDGGDCSERPSHPSPESVGRVGMLRGCRLPHPPAAPWGNGLATSPTRSKNFGEQGTSGKRRYQRIRTLRAAGMRRRRLGIAVFINFVLSCDTRRVELGWAGSKG